MNFELIKENMINWAMDHLGKKEYAHYCLSFIEDALEISNQIEIFGGNSAKESATLYQEAIHTGRPERGTFVFYDCLCLDQGKLMNYGHCGICIDEGRIIHAWDQIRIDDYLALEKLTANSNDHPRYLGYVPIEYVMNYRPKEE